MIDALLATLEREGEADVARVLAEGRAQAAAVAAESEARIVARKRAALGSREAEGRVSLERQHANARRAARGRVLAARAALLERLFAALRECLPGVAATPAYRETLAGDVMRAVRFAGGRPAVLRCAASLASALARVVKTNGKLRIEAVPDIAAGYRLVTTDGVLEVDATLEGALERLRPRIALAALTAFENAGARSP
ncbi:MAG TPA: V-type ATP synthase subunit E family protein [Gemmatimonadaceae bacterium]|nr:V-type ATP synthase subunit E family protein [Gemmatimonadaceae bacterium]